jgi:hypothetical protein
VDPHELTGKIKSALFYKYSIAQLQLSVEKSTCMGAVESEDHGQAHGKFFSKVRNISALTNERNGNKIKHE